MRDAVIETIIEGAAKDRDVLFISADLGAAALDGFRRDFPDQFIHAGIAEQNMVDLASGLALSGKKVFLYAMAPFITLRCLEEGAVSFVLKPSGELSLDIQFIPATL